MYKGIKFFKKPQLTDPILVVAWPGMGEVAYRSARYLVEKLKSESFACLKNTDYFYPTTSVIKNGILNIKEPPQNYFYFWKNPNTKTISKPPGNDLIIFLSNTQPDLSKAEGYVDSVLEIARLYKVKSVVSFAAMPAPIEHTQNPAIWFAATNSELSKSLRRFGLKMMSEGEVSGMNGMFLGLAKKRGFSGFCLLGEIPIYTIQIENPRAVFAILERFKKILNLPLNLNDLGKQSEFIEGEINKLVSYLKEGIGIPTNNIMGMGPISEAEIEKIKKSLTQLTHLPQSVKEKVDKLFELSKNDISKTNELKQELDKWNVYKEYEDRFLDLFKKPKDKGN